MKNFVSFCLKIAFIVFVIALMLDVIYSTIYATIKHRGKVDFVYNTNGQNYDVVILGSSRANNHFVPEIFKTKGLKAFNFGMSGGHLFEASLLLKMMIHNNYKIKTVLLEADLNLSNDRRADGISARFLPYIHQSDITRNHFKIEPDFVSLNYVPFYRYIKFENKIGFRELFFSAIGKKTNHLNNEGYNPLLGVQNGNMKYNIKNLNPRPANKYYEEIKRICYDNNIRLIAIMTPMCENVVGIEYFEKVKKVYPEIYNYENSVLENKYFASCGHLNNDGARKFTKIIVNDFFNK